MPSYNGLVAKLTKGTSTGGENAVLTGISYANAINGIPLHLSNAIFGVKTTGISGTYSAYVVGAVGGATFVVAGQTGIATNGSTLLGNSHICPRPAYVAFASAEDGSGFTSEVFVSGFGT